MLTLEWRVVFARDIDFRAGRCMHSGGWQGRDSGLACETEERERGREEGEKTGESQSGTAKWPAGQFEL